MWHKSRRHTSNFLKSYTNDLIAASGKLPFYHDHIHYLPLSRAINELEGCFKLISQTHQQLKPATHQIDRPAIYFIHANMTHADMPMIGLISPSTNQNGQSHPFTVLRILENPLAYEFQTAIPWLYRETFSAFQLLISKSKQHARLGDLYQQINHIRYMNAQLKRRNALDAVIGQLRYMRFKHFWDTTHSSMNPNTFVSQTTKQLAKLKNNDIQGIRLPLPNHYDKLAIVAFWLELLKNILGLQHKQWEAYWHANNENNGASLLFYKRKLTPSTLTALLNQSQLPNDVGECLAQTSKHDDNRYHALLSNPDISMLDLLSEWPKLLQEA